MSTAKEIEEELRRRVNLPPGSPDRQYAYAHCYGRAVTLCEFYELDISALKLALADAEKEITDLRKELNYLDSRLDNLHR
jgi:hypothetical protein